VSTSCPGFLLTGSVAWHYAYLLDVLRTEHGIQLFCAHEPAAPAFRALCPAPVVPFLRPYQALLATWRRAPLYS